MFNSNSCDLGLELETDTVELGLGDGHRPFPSGVEATEGLSRDQAIPRLRRAIVAPCTTTIRQLASEVELNPHVDPIPVASVVNLDSVESVDISVLTERLGRLSDSKMREVCNALAVAVDCT